MYNVNMLAHCCGGDVDMDVLEEIMRSASSRACSTSFTSVTALITADESGNWKRLGFLLRRAIAVLTIIPMLPRSGALRACLKILWIISLQHSSKAESAWSIAWLRSSVMVDCVAGKGRTQMQGSKTKGSNGKQSGTQLGVIRHDETERKQN